jgi:hypothetical protein
MSRNKLFRIARYKKVLGSDTINPAYQTLLHNYLAGRASLNRVTEKIGKIDNQIETLARSRIHPRTEEDIYRNQELMAEETKLVNERAALQSELNQALDTAFTLREKLLDFFAGKDRNDYIPDNYLEYLGQELEEYNPTFKKLWGEIVIQIFDNSNRAIRIWLELDAPYTDGFPFIPEEPFEVTFWMNHNMEEDPDDYRKYTEFNKSFLSGYSHSPEFIKYLTDTIDEMLVAAVT